MSDLERYRPSVHDDVLPSWAVDTQAKVDELNSIIKNTIASLVRISAARVELPNSTSPEAGRDGVASYWPPEACILEQKDGEAYMHDLRRALEENIQEQPFVQSPNSTSAPPQAELSDTDLLSFLASNAEWDGHRYWLPEFCIAERESGAAYTPPPTLDDLRSVLKEKLEEQLRVNQEAASRRLAPR